MPHLTAADATTFNLHGVRFDSFASSRSGAAHLGAWRATFAPGTPGQAHSMSAEEVLHVLEGTLDVEVDDDHFRAAAGDAVLVPAGARFRVSNTTDAPAQAWVVTQLGMQAVMDTSQDPISPPWAQ